MKSASQTPDLQADLARRLRAARTLSGKTVPELAREAGWSKEKQYRFERGVQVPDALELAQVARLTECPVDFLLGNTSESEGAPVLPPPLPLVNDKAAAQ